MNRPAPRHLALYAAIALLLAGLLAPVAAQPVGVDQAVADAEAARIAVIKKVSPAVVAVCIHGGDAMGSGVLIDAEGYALTNFHVIEGTGPVLQCGLPDGVLYDAVLVGLDPVGDTALIKLLPREEGKKFPFAELGDSDTLKIGDWTFTAGNPHGFALDFTPSVAYGIVSGIHRYLKISPQSVIEYTDAIQVETAVNPGNSGGPLFDTAGRVVGINSAASVRRGGANAGLGIAISINQVKNFLGHLRGGLTADHATLGALIRTADDGELSKLVVGQILENSDAYRRGLRTDDQLLRFAGRDLPSTNQYKNILGLFPKGWRVPVVFRQNNERKEALVRLMGALPAEREEAPPPPGGPPRPGPSPRPKPPVPADSPAGKLYKPQKGYANAHFNAVERDRLLAAAKKHGDFSAVGGAWAAEGTYEAGARKGGMRFEVAPTKGEDGGPLVALKLNIEHKLEPLKANARDMAEPIGSGGLMVALYQYHRFLTRGPDGFEGEFAYGGYEPFYPFPADGSAPKSLADLRVDTEVVRTKHGAAEAKWYFDRQDGKLLGYEVFLARDEDPCEVYLSDYKAVDGRQLPHRLEVRHGDKRYAVFSITSYTTKAN